MAPLRAVCLKTVKFKVNGTESVFCVKGKSYDVVEYSEDLMTIEAENSKGCYQTTINDPDFLVHYEEDK
ncbi:glycosyltransferase [Bacillus phage JBP901]|uniref:Putative glycosyltransferase family A (GT-A) protein n=1 Tax=Bacillus phage JBP901 TaxID=1498212 RepID=A0A0E3DEN0_9CAUD|nr:glycosyltransferase [Bacillus phage JBP901]ANY29387.1 putative glycosyltransferase family A [Bacillus phage PK16]AUM58892.1 hypothetical protein BCP01_091 [Bacillus phage BCP01]UJH95601.1 hypothetical protein [Bacillus phage vB_BtM_BMBsp2]WPF70101.1 glycosyltransferase [Bacillus phage BC-VP]WQZ49467.1 putative glycosyltransferase family A (GT-A) protein [Bacillus phage Z3]